MKVVIIDYQLGNLFSVKHACDFVGIDSVISSDIEEIRAADALILPGVGAFGAAMNNMNKLGLVEVVKEQVEQKKPFLGICLGMQLLLSESEEFGAGTGLGIIPGKVKKLPMATSAGEKISVPQIAWHQINEASNMWSGSCLNKLNSGDYMYFVHSFYAEPEDENAKLVVTNYADFEFCSGLTNGDNVEAFQFHPEKSGENGLKLYRDWAVRHKIL